MTKSASKNARIKHRYFAYLEEAKRMSATSVDHVAAAIACYERILGHKDFASFRIEHARKFKRDLASSTNADTGKPLATATIRSRLIAVKAFFFWLADQPGYRRSIKYSDCEYFNPNANDTRIATAQRQRPSPTLEQVHHVIATCPTNSDIALRDRALIAFALITGMRDAAMASMEIGLVDMAKKSVFQDARRVHTKNAKTMTTFFFPVGGEAEAILGQWIDHLTQHLLFGPQDPLFPKTLMGIDPSGGFTPIGLSRQFWTSAAPIRRIFRERFAQAGLPYFHPHSLRHTLARLGERHCTNPEQFKAWSQNLGHEHVLTTLTAYGKVDTHRQAEILAGMGINQASGSLNDDERAILRKFLQTI